MTGAPERTRRVRQRGVAASNPSRDVDPNGQRIVFVGDGSSRWIRLLESAERNRTSQTPASDAWIEQPLVRLPGKNATLRWQHFASEDFNKVLGFLQDSGPSPPSRQTLVVFVWPSVCSPRTFADQFERCQRFLAALPGRSSCIVLAAGDFDAQEKWWLKQIGVRGLVRQPLDLIRWVNERIGPP